LFLFAATLFAADVLFALVPSLPPWMADGTPRLIAGSTGSVTALDSNPTAAFPSLHVPIPFELALWCCRHERPEWRTVGRLLIVLTLLVFCAVVYTGEHFVLDGLGGVALGLAVYRVLDGFGLAQERRAREARAPVQFRRRGSAATPLADDDEFAPAAAA
jgi:hypothetical protein